MNDVKKGQEMSDQHDAFNSTIQLLKSIKGNSIFDDQARALISTFIGFGAVSYRIMKCKREDLTFDENKVTLEIDPLIGYRKKKFDLINLHPSLREHLIKWGNKHDKYINNPKKYLFPQIEMEKRTFNVKFMNYRCTPFKIVHYYCRAAKMKKLSPRIIRRISISRALRSAVTFPEFIAILDNANIIHSSTILREFSSNYEITSKILSNINFTEINNQ